VVERAVGPGREWLFKRNCSISPQQLMQVYGLLCAVSLAISVFFTIRGAWYILGFSIVELAAVAYAFIYYARHARDREYIALEDDRLFVEIVQAEKVRQFRLMRRQTAIRLVARTRLIGLESAGLCVEVGRFLTETKRREFMRELRREMRMTSTPVN